MFVCCPQIDIDVEQLFNLRQAQISYRLSDKVPSQLLIDGPFVFWFLICSLCGMLCFWQLAEDLFREHTRKLIEENISAALERLKSRTRTVYDPYHMSPIAAPECLAEIFNYLTGYLICQRIPFFLELLLNSIIHTCSFIICTI